MSDTMVSTKNDLLAQSLIKGLKSRNITGYYVKTKEDALAKALELIPEGSTVTRGGSATIAEIGLDDALKAGSYHFNDRNAKQGEERALAERAAFSSDVYLGSCNAVTSDGIMVNIDGHANRISAYAFGPKKLILVVGMNKVCPDIDSACKRARNTAAVCNAQRFPVQTPCKKTGTCMDCKSSDSICAQFLITRRSMDTDRIHVILVDEVLGY